METFSDVIAAIGYIRLAALTGRPTGTVSSWQTRDVLPPEYWSIVVREATEKKIDGVTHEALARMAERRAAQARRRSGPDEPDPLPAEPDPAPKSPAPAAVEAA